MILFHAKRDGTVTTTPDLVPQGSSMQDLVVVSEFDYAYCAIKLYPASGEYIEDIPCTPILQKDYSTIFTAALPPKATVVAGSVGYQLVFTAADGTTQTTLAGSFTVPRGVPVSTPGSVEELSVKTINDLYTIMANTYGLFVGHERDIYQSLADIAALKKTVSSAGYVTIPTAQWNDGAPTIAEFTLDGFGAGMTAMLIPADSNTQTAAREARLSAYPAAFPIDSDTQTVEIIRANADKAPDIPLRFAYLILKTSDTSIAPTVAIIGVDAYGDGGGTASGVDESAVRAIITAMLGNVANERQYSAANPPPYPVTSVNGKVGAVSLSIPSEAADVKADPAGTAESMTAALRDEVNGKLADYDKSTAVNNKISSHNTSTESHADLRLELQRLADRINAALNSTDTSLDDLKEIVAYIKANKNLIDGITSSKVNVTDIVNNLTTDTANVPLSAAQGVALKMLIDSLEEIVEGKVTAEQVATQISTALRGYPTTADMGAAISNATKNLAPQSSIPTKVSQLSNDSGYLNPTTGDQRYPAKQATETALTEHGNKIADLEKAMENATIEEAESVEWLDENGDPEKEYSLPDGYIYAWMEKYVEITHNANTGIINLIPEVNKSMTADLVEQDGVLLSDLIEFDSYWQNMEAAERSKSTVTISGINKLVPTYTSAIGIYYYKADGTFITYMKGSQLASLSYSDNTAELALPTSLMIKDSAYSGSGGWKSVGYVRLQLGISSNEITKKDVANLVINVPYYDFKGTKIGWFSTGRRADANAERIDALDVRVTANEAKIEQINEALGGEVTTASNHRSIAFVGDSITYGSGASGYGTLQAGWVGEVMARCGYDVETSVNLGVSGAGFVQIAPAPSSVTIVDVVNAQSFAAFDDIIVSAGINDWKNTTIALADFWTNLKAVFVKLRSDNKYARLYYQLPYNCKISSWTGSTYDTYFALDYKEGGSGNYCLQYTLANFRNMIVDKINTDEDLKTLGIRVIDYMPLTRNNIDQITGDGLHPNAVGYKIIGKTIAQILNLS